MKWIIKLFHKAIILENLGASGTPKFGVPDAPRFSRDNKMSTGGNKGEI